MRLVRSAARSWCSNDREAKVIIEARDDIAEGVPEGWSIDRAVIYLSSRSSSPAASSPGVGVLGGSIRATSRGENRHAWFAIS